MAHGTPDWGVTAGAVTTYQLGDLGELAVRLGSIVTFDRRGDVMFLDSFEDGLGLWGTSKSGGGAAVSLTTLARRSGLLAVQLTGGSTPKGTAAINRSGPLPVLSRLGGEVSFSMPGAIGIFTLKLVVYDGTNLTTYNVAWDDATTTLSYLDSGGVLQAIVTDIDLYASAGLFHTLKLVIDATEKEYVRAILDDRAFSLAGKGGSVDPSGVAPRLDTEIELAARSGQNDVAYVDDVVLTQNEPA